MNLPSPGRVSRRLRHADERRDDEGRGLPLAGLEPEPDPSPPRRPGRRSRCPCTVDAAPELRRASRPSLRASLLRGHACGARPTPLSEVGDEVGSDAPRHGVVDRSEPWRRGEGHRGHAPRREPERVRWTRVPRAGPRRRPRRARAPPPRRGWTGVQPVTRPRRTRPARRSSRRPRRADDRQRAEHGELRRELGRPGRDEQRREQPDRHGVHEPPARALGDRPRVGDHEEEEDEDLGRGDEQPPEVEPGDRAEVPRRRHLVPGRGEHRDARRERQPEADRDPDEVQPREDREPAADDEHERQREPHRHRPPPERQRVRVLRTEKHEAEHEPEVRWIEDVAAAEGDHVLREQPDRRRCRRRSTSRSCSTSRRARCPGRGARTRRRSP